MKRVMIIFSSLVFSISIYAVDLKDCSFLFRVKRFFNPVENMTLNQKNKELVSYCDANVPKSSMFLYTPEDFTPKGKYSAEIIYLCQHGASINIDVPYKWMDFKLGTQSSHFKPVYLFIAKNNLVSTRTLIDLGADIKKPILGEYYPLVFAYTKEMTQLLIE